MSLAFAGVGLPFLAVKSIMLRHPLASKWGLLPAACALFSLAHVVVATNVNLFARRRWEMGLMGRVHYSVMFHAMHMYHCMLTED